MAHHSMALTCSFRPMEAADLFFFLSFLGLQVWDFLVATQASSDQQRKFVRLPLEWAGEMGLPVWFKRLFPYGNFTSQLALGEVSANALNTLTSPPCFPTLLSSSCILHYSPTLLSYPTLPQQSPTLVCCHSHQPYSQREPQEP